MTTLQEKIEVMQAFARGEKIEWIHKNDKNDNSDEWDTTIAPRWNWEKIDYRIAKPEPVKLKLLAYLSEHELRWLNIVTGNKPNPTWKRVPSEDKEITLP